MVRSRARPEESDQEGGRIDHLLEVVEDEQEVTIAQHVHEAIDQGTFARLANAEGARDGGNDLSGVDDRRQRDERRGIREVVPTGNLRGSDGEPGLADAAGSGQRDEPQTRLPQKREDGVGFLFATDKGTHRHRQWWTEPLAARKSDRHNGTDAGAIGGGRFDHGRHPARRLIRRCA